MRVVNAFDNGSWLDMGTPGGPEFQFISDRQMIGTFVRLDDDRVLLGLEAGSGQRPCILLYDVKTRKIVGRTNVFSDAHHIVLSPGGDKIVISHVNGFTLLSADELATQRVFIGAKKREDHVWDLIEIDEARASLPRELKSGKIDNAIDLHPYRNGLRLLSDGTLRNVRVHQKAHTNEPNHFSTFVTKITVEDFSFDAMTVERRPLVERFSYEQEIKAWHELVSVSPCGSRALLRHHADGSGADVQGKRGGLFAQLFGKPSPKPRKTGSSSVELWNLDSCERESCFEVADLPLEDLDSLFRAGVPKPAMVAYKYDDPVAPVLIADGYSAASRTHEPDTVWRRLMSLPAAAGWTETGCVILFQNGHLRRFEHDGTAGPMVRIENFPSIDPNERMVDGTTLELQLECLEGSRLRVTGERVSFDVDMPASKDVTSVKPSVRFDATTFGQDMQTARKLAAKARPANVEIRSRKPEAIVAGLNKMAPIVSKKYENVVFDQTWTPMLMQSDAFLEEDTFCNILLQTPDTPGAADALDDLIAAFLSRCGPTNLVVHQDGEEFSLTRCVIASILLRGEVSDPCMEWLRRRDEYHEWVFGQEVIERVLPEFAVASEDVLRLVVLLAVQDAMGQQPEAIQPNAPGRRSLMSISAMDWVARAMEVGELEPERLATVIAEEVQGFFDRRAQLQTSSVSARDFIERVTANLDHTSSKEAELAAALLA